MNYAVFYFTKTKCNFGFSLKISSRNLKLPSTPDVEYPPELLNTPDREEIKSIHQYLKQQSLPGPSSLATYSSSASTSAIPLAVSSNQQQQQQKSTVIPSTTVPDSVTIVTSVTTAIVSSFPSSTTSIAKSSTSSTICSPSTSALSLPSINRQHMISTPNIPANRKFIETHQISSIASRKAISTPESSQTDSDDVSPQIQRKRKTNHGREILPRFSISIEDEHSGTSSSENAYTKENHLPISHVTPSSSIGGSNDNVITVGKHRSRSVIKSASALGLSLMVSTGICHYMLFFFKSNY